MHLTRCMQTKLLTHLDVQTFRSVLLSERNKLSSISNSKNVLEVLSSPGSVALDDHPSLIHEQWVALRAHRIDSQKLLHIDAALERINRGEFGVCRECGKTIARRRLEVIAWAACCVPCQERIVDVTGEKFEIGLAAA